MMDVTDVLMTTKADTCSCSVPFLADMRAVILRTVVLLVSDDAVRLFCLDRPRCVLLVHAQCPCNRHDTTQRDLVRFAPICQYQCNRLSELP